MSPFVDQLDGACPFLGFRFGNDLLPVPRPPDTAATLWCRAREHVRWVKPPYGSRRERIEYEADPRQAELIFRAVHRAACLRQVRNQNLELITSQCSTGMTTLSINLQRCDYGSH